MTQEALLRSALIRIIRGHMPRFTGEGQTTEQLEIYLQILGDNGRLAERDQRGNEPGRATS